MCSRIAAKELAARARGRRCSRYWHFTQSITGKGATRSILLLPFVFLLCCAPTAIAQNHPIPPMRPYSPPSTELDLPASERNSLFTNFPVARAPWYGHHGGKRDPLPLDQLVPQQLYPNQDHIYTMRVPKSAYISVTIHPRRGFITWNISHTGVLVMTHPFYTHQLPQREPIPPGQKARQARPDSLHYRDPSYGSQGQGAVPHDPYAPHPRTTYYYGRRKKRSSGNLEAGKRSEFKETQEEQVREDMMPRKRAKRCCVSGAPPHEYDYDVMELFAGQGGTSIGPGSLTYFKEDVTGGDYNIRVHNLGGGMADFLIFTTLHPQNSPYPRMQGNDPQIKVGVIEQEQIEIYWEPPPEQPDVVYCPVFHAVHEHREDDVHSSSYAQWMERPQAGHPPCVHSPVTTATLRGLRPDTEYHIDLLARNPHTLREATFVGLIARTQPSYILPVPLTYLSEETRSWFGLMWRMADRSGVLGRSGASETTILTVLLATILIKFASLP